MIQAIRDIENSGLIDSNAGRDREQGVGTMSISETGASGFARDRTDGSIGIDPADQMTGGIRHEEDPVRGDSDAGGTGELSLRTETIADTIHPWLTGDGSDRAVVTDPSDQPILRVGQDDIAQRIDGDALRAVKLSECGPAYVLVPCSGHS